MTKPLTLRLSPWARVLLKSLATLLKYIYNVVMTTIRRLTYIDYPKLKRLISYLCTDENDNLAHSLMEEPIGYVNAMLPLSLKFKSESFILIENKEILGLITVCVTRGNPFKINITRLIFKENRYDVGKHLVDFVIQKQGGKGASTFVVTVDECHEELLDLFVNGCGFRQCSSETLWKIEKPVFNKSKMSLRPAQNSDSIAIADLYNSELENIFKPSLLRASKEFTQPFFEGFTSYYKNRYVIEESNRILGYFSITTSDNLNYILDITTNAGYDLDYDSILDCLLCEIAKNKRAFYPIVKQKKYVRGAEKFGDYLKNKGFIPIQTQHILVKDFYKPVAQESSDWKVFLLGENQISS